MGRMMKKMMAMGLMVKLLLIVPGPENKTRQVRNVSNADWIRYLYTFPLVLAFAHKARGGLTMTNTMLLLDLTCMCPDVDRIEYDMGGSGLLQASEL